MQILIADSGSTKTDWCYLENDNPVFLTTEGLHPFYLNQREQAGRLKKAIGSFSPRKIFFYGAGCANEEMSKPLKKLLNTLFAEIPVEFRSDLCGTGRAFFGNKAGIAGILGTGSGAGVVKSGEIVEQIPPLGYILGDEGSAADMAKGFLKDWLRGRITGPDREWIKNELPGLSNEAVYDNLYMKSAGSKYLGALAGKLYSGTYPRSLQIYAENAITKFVREQVIPLSKHQVRAAAFTGSVAVHHHEILEKVLEDNGFNLIETETGVIKRLFHYHSKSQQN